MSERSPADSSLPRAWPPTPPRPAPRVTDPAGRDPGRGRDGTSGVRRRSGGRRRTTRPSRTSLLWPLVHVGNYCAIAYDGAAPIGVCVAFLACDPAQAACTRTRPA